eukprot:6052333-Pleurochrysis_carterae.AAC.4
MRITLLRRGVFAARQREERSAEAIRSRADDLIIDSRDSSWFIMVHQNIARRARKSEALSLCPQRTMAFWRGPCRAAL